MFSYYFGFKLVCPTALIWFRGAKGQARAHQGLLCKMYVVLSVCVWCVCVSMHTMFAMFVWAHYSVWPSYYCSGFCGIFGSAQTSDKQPRLRERARERKRKRDGERTTGLIAESSSFSQLAKPYVIRVYIM